MPLPFQLPSLSRGFATLTPSARRLGVDVAAAAAEALRKVLDAPVALLGRASPGPAWPRTPAVRLAIDLAALPALATLEVEPSLIVRLLDRLAGGQGSAPGASALTPLEQAAFELLTLLALEAACSVAGVEQALAPRLARAGPDAAAGALGVELELVTGAIRGRARLLLPAAAVRALGAGAELPESPLRLPVSIRRGTASLLSEELEGLEPGDVVLVQDPADGREALVLPGGYRAAGRLGPDGFHCEEMSMTTRTAQIPVTLEVELCRVEVPLGELARLAPGAVLPLCVDRSGQVTLRAGERTMASGELVEVDGAVGVRIASLEVDP
jgi:type III secretion protein Q